MNKAVTHTYKGMAQDITKSKFSNEFYFEGRNIRIIATDSQSTGSVTNEKGNSLILKIPNPVINYSTKIISYGSKTLSYKNNEINYNSQSGDQIIIGKGTTRDYAILFTTDDNGFDCIWSVKYEDYDLRLLYLRDLGFSKNNLIQCLNNFENSNIDKIYWVNGINQMQFLNINHSLENQDLEELIDLPLNVIDSVGKYSLSEPIISRIVSGGTHTSGMIQYAYNLYRLNSSQTKMSPVSKLIPLDKGNLGGGSVNEIVGSIPIVNIDGIDTNYTNIKVYSIKYTSYNEVPTITIIDDRKIPSNGSIEIFDDNLSVNTISLEDFLFLGSDIIVPKNIESKFNRLFTANYNEVNFDVDLDFRAYSFPILKKETYVYNDLFLNPLTNQAAPSEPSFFNTKKINSSFTDLSQDDFDSINLDYDLNRYLYDSSVEGGEGKYLKYELTQSTEYNPNNRYFKDDEIYRIGIEFFNSYGQISLPKWIADFKAPSGNLNGRFNTIKVTLKEDFFTWLNNDLNFLTKYDKPVGYKLLIAERTINDKTIVANGALGTMMINDKSSRDVSMSNTSDREYVIEKADQLPKIPNFLLRNCNESSTYGVTKPMEGASHLLYMNKLRESPETEVCRAYYGDKDTAGRFYQFNSMLQLYSPEIIFKEGISLNNGLELKIKGSFRNSYNAVWCRKYNDSGGIEDEGKALGGIHPSFASEVKEIVGDPYVPLGYGLISHPPGSNPHKVSNAKFYRGYGYVPSTETFSTLKVIDIYEELVTDTLEDENDYISKYGKGIQITTNSTDFEKAYCKFTITPNLLYITDDYTIDVTSDSEGNNSIYNYTVIGGGAYTTPDLLKLNPYSTSTDVVKKYQYYLKITTPGDVVFKGTVDCYAKIENTSSVLKCNEKSLGNIFSINDTSIVGTDEFNEAPNKTQFKIYGKPELTEKGQSFTNYNNNQKYRYTNSFQSILTDGDTSWKDDGSFNRRIISSNSENNRCITFVSGPKNSNVLNDDSVNHMDRNSIEDLFDFSGLSGNNNLIIAEIVKTKNEIYLGGIYGGNSYEDKQRSNYIEIGNYNKIDELNPEKIIDSPGDTFVNNFRFLRVVKREESILTEGTIQQEEIVEFLTETTINLAERNDTSLTNWDSTFFNKDSDYHKYNRVYSQLPDLIKRRNLNYNFKKISKFDTNIISSKLKSAGELIDSWTDLLQNEVMTLNGKYGAINSLISFQDEMYAIQDKAFAYISINPRIQIQGSDGLAVQLGTGNVLDKYKYISTENGTINRFGVVATQRGVYFFDALNKALTVFKGQIEGISDTKSMHSFFINNTINSDLIKDNPVLGNGISCGYDYVNDDVFFTFHQKPGGVYKPYTLSFNENTDSFVSFYDYMPSFYINRGGMFMTTNPNNDSIYRQGVGEYNTFYGIKYPSSITFNVNPEPNVDCVFDNINFKSDVTLNEVDQPDKTLTSITAYNDYQNQSMIAVPLVSGRNNNLRRKFRDWNALIPKNGRNRIRAPYIKLKLDFNNPSNYKLILHDVSVFYTV